MAFAPGKILWFGEHAVVYGVPAIAAATSCGLHATAHASAAPRLRVPAWQLDVAPDDGSRVGEAFARLLEALPEAWRASVEITGTLPPGAGLGSSASLAVASARAMAERVGEELDDDLLFGAAMASERVFHATPSGLDHAVIMTGGLIAFQRIDGGRSAPLITSLSVSAPIELIIAQVERGADTGAMVQGVADRRAAAPSRINGLLERIGDIVGNAQSALAAPAPELDLLGGLMNQNHEALSELGVSTPTLDERCQAARDAGAFGAKLTGAGGGGCLLALVDARSADSVEATLASSALTLLRCSIQA
ncbi:MAG: mevalonate kinase [Bradymonadia bacterium]|jgi:mevalonate kinase